jgi:dethiobiotin synthetase
MSSVFITGTDTHVGKTVVACLLLQAFSKLGYKTLGLKPLASGCYFNRKNTLENYDAILLQKNSSVFCHYKVVNPITLKEPIAPHLSAKKVKLLLNKKYLVTVIKSSLQDNVDLHVIEGAGGWALPLNNDERYADAIVHSNIPVILVVGMRLGCLNHALLTCDSLLHSGVTLLGWIANCIDPHMIALEENIDSLVQCLKAPYLGLVSYNMNSININTKIIEKQLFR